MANNKVAANQGNFFAEFGGSGHLGRIESWEGGLPKAEKMDQHGGPMALAAKAHSFLTYSDVKWKMNVGQSSDAVEWVQMFLNSTPEPRTAMVSACNVKLEAMAIQEFIGLWISKLTFDELDASKKDGFGVSVECKVNQVLYKKGDGKKITPKLNADSRLWTANSFRFECSSLPCDYITKIKLPAFQQKFDTLRTGASRHYENIPGTISVEGDLEVTMPITHGWDEWKNAADSYLIKGNMTQSAEMVCAITFLAHDGKTELGAIEFEGCSISEVTRDALKGGAEKIAQFTVKLSVTTPKLKITKNKG